MVGGPGLTIAGRAAGPHGARPSFTQRPDRHGRHKARSQGSFGVTRGRDGTHDAARRAGSGDG
eukprot:9761895-Lingulodinium_polyedra.AAC.1